ncbi:DNA cytosine methyltransferase [Pseudoalteromonas luteoviolacea]|uniref:DNA cytosine methyltransferase n=1 Tax=Pseudoalteromonas luteoviolacea TaxID=43657 RepID=UPI001F1EE59A|nr:DNA cytosine methyltransferase [Pseudoalteromonas luteoviolacea]MCF6438049.1 DNA cytosine methyltransferase [Pseudoalteromonas luteoviolacea]
MESLYSVKEAASLLSTSEQSIRALCRQKIIESELVGKSWVIEKKSLDNYMKNKAIEDHPLENKTFNHKPKLLSFFSGAMGLDLGLEKSGFDCLLACEVDKHCRSTINTNKPEMALLGDIRDYSAQDIMNFIGKNVGDEIDVICGGPPCQAFSTAGKRKAFEDERGNVFLKYIDIAMEIKPKYLVIENVRGLLSAPLKHRPHSERTIEDAPLSYEEEKGGALLHIIKKLEANGYGVSFELYNAANFGVPQSRERVIMICSKDGTKAPYIEPTHSEKGDFNLPVWKTFKELYQEKDLASLEHDHVEFPEKRLKYYRQLKAGENWKSLPIDLQKEAMGKSFYSGGGKSGFLRRLSWDKPTPTVVTHPAMPATDLAHPVENRPLSVQEYKAIQQFPDNWSIEGKLLEKYRQIGNAVPVGLGYALGKHLIKLMNGKEVKNYQGFKYSRYKNTCDVEWKASLPKCIEEINHDQLELLKVS